MSNTPIRKSFLFKLPPPFIRSLAPPNLSNVPSLLYQTFVRKTTLFNKSLYKKYLTIKLNIFIFVSYLIN